MSAPGEPIEGRPAVLMAFDSGQGVPGPIPVSVCGVCSALVDVRHDGEMRHLVSHELGGQLGGPE